jgi:hypothetical protein
MLRLLANLWKISQAQPVAATLRVPTALANAVSVQPLTAIRTLEDRHREGSCENAKNAFDQERYTKVIGSYWLWRSDAWIPTLGMQ